MQRMRPRPREPDRGPAAGAPRPRTLSRGGSPEPDPASVSQRGGTPWAPPPPPSSGSTCPRTPSTPACSARTAGPAGSRSPTTPRGHAALLAWADRHAGGAAVHFCLEATGPYSEALADALHAAGRRVSVANPARVKSHATACGQGNKTDPADARPIAAYARDRERPRPWLPPSPEVRELQALVRRRDDLRRAGRPGEGPARLPAPHPGRPAVGRPGPSGSWRGRPPPPGRGRRPDRRHPGPGGRPRLLESIPGVGRQTATTVLAELPPIDRLPSAESAAAYCRPGPVRVPVSGKTVRKRTRLSKAGNPRLRKALFLPTQTAVRFNPLLQGSSTAGRRPGSRRCRRSGRACGSW